MSEATVVNTKQKNLSIYQMACMALMAAIMCILGPLSIPIGPIPVSLTNLAVYFTVYILGTRFGTGSYALYLLLGIVGLPVFSGYAGGIGKIAGPTGGYLIGFILMALIGGVVMEKCNRKLIPTIIGWIVGTAVDYMLGTIWFVIVAHCTFGYAFTVCVVPFILVDLAKIILGTILGMQVRKPLMKAGIVK